MTVTVSQRRVARRIGSDLAAERIADIGRRCDDLVRRKIWPQPTDPVDVLQLVEECVQSFSRSIAEMSKEQTDRALREVLGE